MSRKGCLPDNGQHNITKEKKELQGLNEKLKVILPLILHLPWHCDKYNSLERKRVGNWVLVWSAGPGRSAWVDRKTKMAAASCGTSDNSKNIVVSLSEDDIPGAKLPREIPEQCNVQQLKRWLSCRGAFVSGKKTQLIARFVYTFISVCFIYLESYSFEINPRSL